MAFHIESFGLSDVGCLRLKNQDAWGQANEGRLFILADGMGGRPSGEVASSQTVDILSRLFERRLGYARAKALSSHEIELHLHTLIDKLNEQIYHMAQEKDYYRGMGTTLCCLYLHNKKAIYAHVGDSRIYQLRNQELTALTADHNLKSDNPQGPCTKHILTRAIGVAPKVTPTVTSAQIENEDLFLLCSDGLSNCLPHMVLQNLLQSEDSLSKICYRLIHEAKKRGAPDNVTVVLVKIKESHEPAYLP